MYFINISLIIIFGKLPAFGKRHLILITLILGVFIKICIKIK